MSSFASASPPFRASARQSLAENKLLIGAQWSNTVGVEGYQPREGENMNPKFNSVSERFFESLGMPLVEGREFTPADGSGAQSRGGQTTLSHGIFSVTRAALGRRFGSSNASRTPSSSAWCATGRADQLREEPSRNVYIPYRQAPELDQVAFYVRTERDPESMIQTLRRETGLVFPGLAFFIPKRLRPQIEEVSSAIATLPSVRRIRVLATLLAAVGLYGVMAWSVARRTREIGIRMALGAERRAVIGMVLREVALLAGVGVAIGVPAALATFRLVRTQLYGLGAARTRSPSPRRRH